MKPSLEEARSAGVGSKGDASSALVERDDVSLEQVPASEEVKADVKATRHPEGDGETFFVQFYPQPVQGDPVGPAPAGGDGHFSGFDLKKPKPLGLRDGALELVGDQGRRPKSPDERCRCGSGLGRWNVDAIGAPEKAGFECALVHRN